MGSADPTALPSGGASQPLAGMRVIELSAYVATPLAGLTLAQLGADVIRIEPIGGQTDRTRLPMSPAGTSLYWTSLNQGKRAIEVDFRSPEGRAAITDLVARSGDHGGIVVSNTVGYPDLTYDVLRTVRPDLIQVQLQGHRDGRSAVDYTIQAEVGLHAVTGPRDHSGPVNDAFPFWDVTCGLYLVAGLLAAERHRRSTGQGQLLNLALHDVALAVLSNLGYLAEAQLAHARERDGNFVFGTFGRDFATGDGGRLMLVALTPRHWEALTEVTGTSEVFAALERRLGVSLAREDARFDHRAVLAEVLSTWFQEQTLDEAAAALERARLPFAPYRTLADLVADDASALRHLPLFNRVEHPGVDAYYAAGCPLVMAGRSSPAAAAPVVGQHTDEVLADVMGYDEGKIRRLRDAGVIGGSPR